MELVLAVVGLVLTAALVAFTEQGAELRSNAKYHVRRVGKGTRQWLRRRRSPHLPEPVHRGDRSRFIGDVSIPDGTKVRAGQRFRKVWEIQNVGTAPWDNRYLAREGPHNDPRRLKSARRVRIPYTLPGERCQIAVNVVAPDEPGSYTAEWKMVDRSGRYLLPNQRPVFVSVDVVYSLTNPQD